MSLFSLASANGNTSTTASAIDDDDDATMWTSCPFDKANPLHQKLQEMEEFLRCSICHNLQEIPQSLSTSCHHSFCKQCIVEYGITSRRTMKRELNCPQCRSVIPVKDGDISKALVPNPTLQTLIQLFKEIRPNLKRTLLVAQDAQSSAARTGQDSSEHDNEKPEGDDDNNNSSSDNEDDNTCGIDDDDDEDYQDDEEENKQPNNRNKNISSGNNNRKTNTTVDFAKNGLQRRKKKAKVMYNHLNKKKIKTLCEEEGFNVQGKSEADMKALHDAYTTLYNTECDSLNPKSQAEIVRIVTRDWNAKQAAARQEKPDRTCVERICKNGTSGFQKFDASWNQGFNDLIANYRARNPNQKKPIIEKSGEPMKEGDSETMANQSSATFTEKSEAPPAAATGDESAGVCGSPNNGKRPSPTQKPPPSTKTKIDNPYKKTRTTPRTVATGQHPADPLNNLNISPPSATILFATENTAGAVAKGPAAGTSTSGQKGSAAGSNQKASSTGSKGYDANESSTNNNGSNNSNGVDMKAPDDSQERASGKGDTNPIILDVESMQQNLGTGVSVSTAAAASKKKRQQRSAVPQRRSGRANCGPWACPRCTFENTTNTWSTARCEMCKETRPKLRPTSLEEQVAITL